MTTLQHQLLIAQLLGKKAVQREPALEPVPEPTHAITHEEPITEPATLVNLSPQDLLAKLAAAPFIESDEPVRDQ